MRYFCFKRALKALHIAALVIFSLLLWDGVFLNPTRATRTLVSEENPRALLNHQSAGLTTYSREAGVNGSRKTGIHNDRGSAAAADRLARFFAAAFGKQPSNSSNRERPLVQDRNDRKETKTKILQRGFYQSAAPCRKVRVHAGFSNACQFVGAHEECKSEGLIDYTHFFYCICENHPLLGHIWLIIWLIVLFYLLGNTAEDYFCCSLEKLSKLLHLSPTVAGVTLLPFGNGAPDVFASIAAFMGTGNGEVGFNSVLGGAVFIICVVAGSVILLVAGTSVHLDRGCFIRDISIFLAALLILCVILIVGKISFFGALAYVSIYILYAITVAAWECLKTEPRRDSEPLHSQACAAIHVPAKQPDEEGVYTLLHDPELAPPPPATDTPSSQSQWISRCFRFPHQNETSNTDESNQAMLGQSLTYTEASNILHFLRKLCELMIEWPLSLPRRLTIPVLEEDRWSQFYAVSSAILAPVLVAIVLGIKSGIIAQGWLISVGLCCGCISGILAYCSTQADHPPTNFVFAWVCGGFFMSLFWFYLIAKELVAVLVSLGVILEIDPAILALTLLAWGNSSGDMMANIALASNGGDDVQIAISGCYAGPMFNTLIGLGLSLVFATWKADSGVYTIPKDDTIFSTMCCLVVGLLWALLLLSSNNMQPSRVIGIGLLILYAIFLSTQISSAAGFSPFKGAFAHG